GVIGGIALIRFKKKVVSSDCAESNVAIRPGGIVNGGNTCYIATCIQCIRTLTRFPKYLEGDKGSEKKNQIRDRLKEILDKLKAGKSILTSEISDFRTSLRNYDNIIHSQNGGEVFEVWVVIASALGIPQLDFSQKNRERQQDWSVVVLSGTN